MRDYKDQDTMGRNRDRDDRGSERAFFRSDGPDRHDREYGRQRSMPGGNDRDDRGSRGRARSDSFDRDPKFGSDAFHKGIPMDETRRLIASNKVEGTPVYGRDGDRLGTVENFMVDKYRGEVVYAVLRSSGGFLGLGQRYFPLDWSELTYDEKADGYCIDLTADQLEDRRSFDANGREWSRDSDSGSDRGRERRDGDRDRYRERGRRDRGW